MYSHQSETHHCSIHNNTYGIFTYKYTSAECSPPPVPSPTISYYSFPRLNFLLIFTLALKYFSDPLPSPPPLKFTISLLILPTSLPPPLPKICKLIVILHLFFRFMCEFIEELFAAKVCIPTMNTVAKPVSRGWGQLNSACRHLFEHARSHNTHTYLSTVLQHSSQLTFMHSHILWTHTHGLGHSHTHTHTHTHTLTHTLSHRIFWIRCYWLCLTHILWVWYKTIVCTHTYIVVCCTWYFIVYCFVTYCWYNTGTIEYVLILS